MREGYKQTTLGIIPEEWEVMKLGEVCDVRDGTHYSPKYHGTGFPFITSKNLKDNGLNFSDVKYISEEDHREFSKRSKVEKGDILFGMIGTIGNPVIVDVDFEFSIKNVALLKFGKSQYLNNVFALNLLKSSVVLKQFSKESNGGVLQFVALGNIRNLIFPIPPLPEQEKIAEILSTVDDKIEVIGEQIEQAQELKKGLMQRLLSKGIGHTQFKDSPLGQIPESWDVKPLVEIVDKRRPIRYGIVQTGENLTDGIPCLRVADFTSRRFTLDSMIRTSFAISSKYPSTILQEGDIVFPLRGRIGDVKIVDNNLAGINLTRGVALLSNSDKVLPDYLFWQLQSPVVVKEIMLKVNGTTLQEIPINGLKTVNIPIAPEIEQQRISSILSTVSKKLDVLFDKQEQYEELKKGLMQQLLTGKLRVNHLIEQTELA